jgi:hypothetical protein
MFLRTIRRHEQKAQRSRRLISSPLSEGDSPRQSMKAIFLASAAAGLGHAKPIGTAPAKILKIPSVRLIARDPIRGRRKNGVPSTPRIMPVVETP